MLLMPSGLSGRYCWSVTIVQVASHMKTFEISSETEYCFQSCWWLGSTPVRRRISRSIGTRTGSSHRPLPGKHVEHVPAEQPARGDREQDREDDSKVFSAHATPQNFSGRSIAYTRYTNAAMLSSNDNTVMVHLHAVAKRDEAEHRRKGHEGEHHHPDGKHRDQPLKTASSFQLPASSHQLPTPLSFCRTTTSNRRAPCSDGRSGRRRAPGSSRYSTSRGGTRRGRETRRRPSIPLFR